MQWWCSTNGPTSRRVSRNWCGNRMNSPSSSRIADGLLYKLSHAEGNLIEDIELIENLEQTKKTAVEVAEKQVEGAKAEKEIAVSREVYRPAAARAALIYFVLNQLCLLYTSPSPRDS